MSQTTDHDRGEELAEQTDATREELLEAIEDAGDSLAEAMKYASRYADHEQCRPSAISGFDNAQQAAERLAEVDPTRVLDTDSEE